MRVLFLSSLVPFAFLGLRSEAHAEEIEGIPFKFQPFAPAAGGSTVYKPVAARAPGEAVLYTAASFPNPFVEPSKCTYSTTATHSWLCDPDHLLTPEEQSVLESRLMKLRDSTEHRCADGRKYFYQAAVAVADDILVPENYTDQQAADEMAAALLRQWGIGNRACHDGMLLLFVKSKDIVALAVREGVERRYMSAAFVPILKTRMHLAYMASGSAGAAVIHGVDLINYQLPAIQKGLGWTAKLLLSLAALYILSVVVVYIITTKTLEKKFGQGE